jgi:hypothetical protein
MSLRRNILRLRIMFAGSFASVVRYAIAIWKANRWIIIGLARIPGLLCITYG